MQRPIEFGADLVVHSTTKYLNGHSDSVGGIVVGVHDDDLEWLKFIQNAEGAILSPFDSFLVLRGTKTLALRMAQHNANGLALAEFLAKHPAVKRVLYPGLPNHPQHELAKRQMRGFGGMLSFDAGSLENARRVCNRVKLMSLAESLGGVETLICHPASMTHASVPPSAAQPSASLTASSASRPASRIVQDLIDDIEQALEPVNFLNLPEPSAFRIQHSALPGRLPHPLEVRLVAVGDGEDDELGDFVGVELADAVPERVEAVAGGLDDDLALGFLLDAAFPAVDRVHRREQVDAGREAFFQQGATERGAVRIGGQRGHHHNIFNTHRLHPQSAATGLCHPTIGRFSGRKYCTKDCSESMSLPPETPRPRVRPLDRAEPLRRKSMAPLRPQAPIWRRALNYLLVFATVVVLVDALVGERGLVATTRARRQADELGSSVARVREENAQLRELADRLKTTRRRSSRWRARSSASSALARFWWW